ncbi:hypothetical protein N2152v2_009212 [Parachlorella kessleri]
MLSGRRRASVLGAAALATVFCVQLFWTHAKLEGVKYLSDQAGTSSPQEPGHLLPLYPPLQWLARRPQAAAREAAAQLVVGQRQALENPAVIVFCYNRVGYLNQTLHSLANLTGLERYTVYVSQDGNDTRVEQLVSGLSSTLFGRGVARAFVHWMRPRVPQLSDKQPGTAWLAQHYGWGLERVFMEQGHSHAIIVEDDMLFSPDFLSYFEATAPLLDADPTLWCISSWNDNGFTPHHEWNASRLLRTSYFPGLGWMLKRDLWLELGPKWPKEHWDHWLRMEDVARGRDCVAPEVNRNRNIGEVGANMNKDTFRRLLATMGWSTAQHVDLGDLSYLLKPAYSAALQRQLAEAEYVDPKLIHRQDLRAGQLYYVPYVIEEYQRLATRLKIWPFPRGHHQHVAFIPYKGARLLVADRRFCPLLPEHEKLRPTADMQPVAAERNQSCAAACVARGLLCRSPDFWFVNMCSVLKQHFPCERGCTIELGPDVPNYVMDASSPGYQYCLVTQRASTCHAVNPGAARLCPCSPPLSPGEQQQPERQLARARASQQQQHRPAQRPQRLVAMGQQQQQRGAAAQEAGGHAAGSDGASLVLLKEVLAARREAGAAQGTGLEGKAVTQSGSSGAGSRGVADASS